MSVSYGKSDLQDSSSASMSSSTNTGGEATAQLPTEDPCEAAPSCLPWIRSNLAQTFSGHANRDYLDSQY